jgi:hypothetical protein
LLSSETKFTEGNCGVMLVHFFVIADY